MMDYVPPQRSVHSTTDKGKYIYLDARTNWDLLAIALAALGHRLGESKQSLFNTDITPRPSCFANEKLTVTKLLTSTHL
jgi:hypothetical protein